MPREYGRGRGLGKGRGGESASRGARKRGENNLKGKGSPFALGARRSTVRGWRKWIGKNRGETNITLTKGKVEGGM